MNQYIHKVQYYETDQMGCVHHSNYIRWFEEARIEFMNQIGADYASMEEAGIISPVLSAACEYKTMTRFGESVAITVTLEEFKNVKFKLSYKVEDCETNELRAVGETTHCFLNKEGNIISLKREKEALYLTFIGQLEEGRK